MDGSRRLQAVSAYPFVRWEAACRATAAGGIDVIRLDVGSPDLAPPARSIDALCAAARDPRSHGYPDPRGIPSLRQAIAAYYGRRFGVDLDPETQVVPLLGSKEGIVALSLACVDPGDAVLVPDPAYAPYARGAVLAGGEPVFLPLAEANGFRPDLAAIPEATARRASVLWLNYPNNPTGAVADLAFLAEAVDFARAYDVLLCHDTAYADIVYDGYAAPSVLEVAGASEVAIEFNSISKTFNMAGWRVGMAVGSVVAVALLSKMTSNIDSGIFRPIQDAAAAAFSVDASWIASRNAVYRERLSLLADALAAIGLEASVPRATFYLWAHLPASWRSEDFALRLLRETAISVAPGTFFGPGGEGSIRVAATESTERILEAARRVRALPRDWSR